MFLDVKQTDEFYEMSMQHMGQPPLTAMFDRRVLLPLATVAQSLSTPGRPPVTAAQIRECALKRWVTLLPSAHTEGDPNARGLPIYALNRLREYLPIAAAGITDAELAAHAEFEEGVIDALLTVDELEYVDDDIAQLIHAREYERRDLVWDLKDVDQQQRAGVESRHLVVRDRSAVEARVAEIDRDLAYLRSLDPATLADAARHRLGRLAHRVRHANDMSRGFIIAPEYGRLHAGWSFFIDFAEHGLNQDGWYCRKPRWGLTLQHPLVTEETSRIPIRVPGFLLEGDRITPTRTLTPDEYRTLWEAADLDGYRRWLKVMWGEKQCPHCKRPVGKGKSAKRVYCSLRCGQAARQATYRKRNPEAVKLSQNRWRRA